MTKTLLSVNKLKNIFFFVKIKYIWLKNKIEYIPLIYKVKDKKILKTALNELQGEDILGSFDPTLEVNFYRTEFINDKQQELVELCKQEDYSQVNQYYSTPNIFNRMYFDEFFDHRIGLRLIYNLIITRFTKGTICDFAAGNGQLALKLSEYGFNVSILDMNEYRVAGIKSKDASINAHVETLESCSFNDESFDITILTECLEHVVNLEKSIRKVNRLMKVGAEVYITVPYLTCIDDESHVRIFDENNLLSAFTQMGFTVRLLKLIGYLNHEKRNDLFMIAEKTRNI